MKPSNEEFQNISTQKEGFADAFEPFIVASDTINYSILLEVSRRRFGVQDRAIGWLADLLADRSQTFRAERGPECRGSHQHTEEASVLAIAIAADPRRSHDRRRALHSTSNVPSGRRWGFLGLSHQSMEPFADGPQTYPLYRILRASTEKEHICLQTR